MKKKTNKKDKKSGEKKRPIEGWEEDFIGCRKQPEWNEKRSLGLGGGTSNLKQDQNKKNMRRKIYLKTKKKAKIKQFPQIHSTAYTFKKYTFDKYSWAWEGQHEI